MATRLRREGYPPGVAGSEARGVSREPADELDRGMRGVGLGAEIPARKNVSRYAEAYRNSLPAVAGASPTASVLKTTPVATPSSRYRTTSSEYGAGATSGLLSASPSSADRADALNSRFRGLGIARSTGDVLAPGSSATTPSQVAAPPPIAQRTFAAIRDESDDDSYVDGGSPPSRPVVSEHGAFLPLAETGLSNLGNTCFMNSILQCLCATPEIVAAAYNGSLSAKGRGKLGKELQSLVLKMHETRSGGQVSPSSFLSKMQAHDKRFSGRRQHDAQEFFISLLDGLSKETNTVVGKPPYKELKSRNSAEEESVEAWAYAKSFEDGPVLDIFQGQLQATTTCKSCGHESRCFDPFMDISLPLPSASDRGSDVASCFAKFTEAENLDDKDGYRCEKCKKGSVSRRLCVRRYPPVLVVHLKRFSGGASSALAKFSRSSSFSSFRKDGTNVDLRPGSVLDLTPYCSLDGGALPTFVDAPAASASKLSRKNSHLPRYRLYGMSNHFGSMGGGHYTADCRSFRTDGWHHFDDSHVHSGGPRGDGSSAYVLFYRLESLPPPPSR